MKKRLMACLTAVCLMASVLSPMALADEAVAGTAEPAAEITAEPTAEPVVTEEPTAEPTEEPVVTEEPTAEPTEEPVVTEEPAAKPTEEPVVTEEPAAEPTEEPVVTEEPAAEPTEEPVVTEEPTAEPTEEPVATEEPAAEPTEEPVATEEPAEKAELAAKLTSGVKYAFANEDVIDMTAAISGGEAPYAVVMNVNGAAVQTLVNVAGEGELALSYAPAAFGVHSIEIVVTDALGAVATAEISVPVPVREEENRYNWEATFADVQLTGNWGEDIVAIAQTQIGYMESERNFIVDSNGVQHGYTRYGEWYGAKYSEWCAMFAAFCVDHAGISKWDFPYYGNPVEWKDQLVWMGAYEDEEWEYQPQPGDLIFFNYEDENEPQHMGIVESATEYWVYTIEGNSYMGVRRQEYELSDARIVGYANTAKLYELAEARKAAEEEAANAGIAVPVIPEGGQTAYTTATDVNVRAEASVNAAQVAKIAESGVELTVTGACASEGALWYAVTYGEYTGYVRGDLVIIVLEEELVPVETAAPAIVSQPETAAWQAGETEAILSCDVENAVSAVWQRRLPGETGWTDVAEGTELTLSADVENMKYVYRCVAAAEDGTTVATDEVTLVNMIYVEWMNEQAVSEEMLLRAMKAGSLETMVLEGSELIYVYDGEAVADLNAETGELIDRATGLVVAIIDFETNTVIPAAQSGGEA